MTKCKCKQYRRTHTGGSETEKLNSFHKDVFLPLLWSSLLPCNVFIQQMLLSEATSGGGISPCDLLVCSQNPRPLSYILRFSRRLMQQSEESVWGMAFDFILDNVQVVVQQTYGSMLKVTQERREEEGERRRKPEKPHLLLGCHFQKSIKLSGERHLTSTLPPPPQLFSSRSSVCVLFFISPSLNIHPDMSACLQTVMAAKRRQKHYILGCIGFVLVFQKS